MKIEIGKRYVLRNGEVTEALKKYSYSEFYKYQDSIRSWSKEGRRLRSDITDYDIVKEYVEEKEAVAAPPSKWQVGDRLDNNWTVVEVTEGENFWAQNTSQTTRIRVDWSGYNLSGHCGPLHFLPVPRLCPCCNKDINR